MGSFPHAQPSSALRPDTCTSSLSMRPCRNQSPMPAISRRQIMRTAAWSVPVIAAAVAAPALAASGDVICGGYFGPGDNGDFTVAHDAIVIYYGQPPKLVRVYVEYENGFAAELANMPGSDLPGAQMSYLAALPLPSDTLTLVQIAEFETRYGIECRPPASA